MDTGYITLAQRTGEEEELYRIMIEGAMTRMRCASPGIIQSFDAEKQTVTVQIAIREKVVIDGNQEWRSIPILVDVPIMLPRAGGYMLTLPITSGNECLVVFGDNCFDAWYQSGGIQNQIDRRRHDLSDGFALIGVWSQPKKISGYSTNSTQFRDEAGTSYVEIKDSVINIIAADTVNINGVNEINADSEKITITATEECTINSPKVEINSDTATINSTETTVNSEITTVNSIETIVNSEIVTVNASITYTISSPQMGLSGDGCNIINSKIALSGNWDSLRKLIDERLITLHNQHTHPGIGSVPAVQLTVDDCATTKVRGE